MVSRDKKDFRELGSRSQYWVIFGIATLTAIVLCLLLWIPGISSDVGTAGAQLEAIRTAFTFGAGTGGGVALWLAIRRQRTTEIDLRQKQKTHDLQVQIAEDGRLHQERVLEVSIQDSSERRITDNFGRALEQIGSTKAAVRLGGIYSLERIANGVGELRQTVVDVMCAYLRMPLDVDIARLGKILEDPNSISGEQPPGIGLDVREEIQVRRTIQRILRDHFRSVNEDKYGLVQAATVSWQGMVLDFEGALLIDFDFSHCVVADVSFRKVHFVGPCDFQNTTFTEYVQGDSAVFHSWASMEKSRYLGGAWFANARFKGAAYFEESHFVFPPTLSKVIFEHKVDFSGAEFVNFDDMIDFAFVKFHADALLEAIPNVDFHGAMACGGAYERKWPAGWKLDQAGKGQDADWLPLVRD